MASHAAANYFWKLGAGNYWHQGHQPIIDDARWDWLEINYPSEEAVEYLNRVQAINPKQKYLMRIWPTNGLGNPKYDLGTACMFDYLYKEGVREQIHNAIKAQVAVCLKLKNLHNLIGFTFLEELPGWWGLGSEVGWTEDRTKVPERFEAYRAAIEKERGKPLVMDQETRLWIGKKYTDTLAEIHKAIKDAAPGKMVLYWHHSGYASLDEKGATLEGQGVYPFHFSDIVKPDYCDGLMAYPNRPENFERRYLWFIRKAKCPYFTQLSHPSAMRLTNWPDAVVMAKTKEPWNMGYFLFCTGACNTKQWNDDPTVPDIENVGGTAMLHQRRICAQEGIGMDIVRAYFRPEVELDAPLNNSKPGGVTALTAVIRNPKDPSYFLKADEAVARNVKASIFLPNGWSVDARHSVPATVSIGDLAPGEQKAVTWYLKAGKRDAVAAKTPIRVTTAAKDMPSGEKVITEDTEVPGFLPHGILSSGTSWVEPGYRIPSDRPFLILEGMSSPVRNPTITDGVQTLTYKGELNAGLKLEIDPKGVGRLYATNLIPPIDTLKDSSDPSRFRCWSEGYTVAGAHVGKYIRGGLKYKATMSGKVTGGAQSYMILRFRDAANEIKDIPCLFSCLTDTWKDAVSSDIDVPADIVLLERVYLYRYGNKGSIWYGQPSLVCADTPSEGLDVTPQLVGQPIRLSQGGLTEITYADEDPPSSTPRVTVRVAKEKPAH
ncbi:MAG: hypothetical protein COZ05_09050 [Armatimonadetes bacterium CG_4_10_14_3_um_filter_59_10]|nr:MAG: hypothetical protein COZ05_09050 [Armatimonadetes bacterium CG_4_10_14_3_um_filter_59_10]